MNRVCLTGRLTRDPEIKLLDTGNLATFTLAIDLGRNNTAFIVCKCFGEKADLMVKTLRKGNLIAVDGKIDQNTFDLDDGTKKVVTSILVQNFDYLEKREKEETEPRDNKSKTPEEIYNELEIDLPDDDLPF